VPCSIIYLLDVRRPQRIARGVTVPFVDLSSSHASLKTRILADISRVIDNGAFVNGPAVERFEQEFAAYCETKHCVGVGSGLDGLRLGLLAAGIEPGDEVIVPALTFVATAEAVVQAGGAPVLVDVSDRDYNIDPVAAEAAVTSRTRFVLPVHLYGQLADMAGLEVIAAERGLSIVEDACQAHGAFRDGRKAGSIGLAAAFSFYPAKNLGALGDAGACVTGDSALAEKVRALREHGQRRRYEHDLQGYTARLDTIQASALLQKLPLLDEWNDQRREATVAYEHGLDGVGDIRLPQVPSGSHPAWHLYVIRTAGPDELRAFLAERGIETGRHYPRPVHLQAAFASLGAGPGTFPVAERLAAEAVSLPLFPGIRAEQLDAVVTSVREYFGRAGDGT
jgi:dTDP-4-amino-4,6-dideoxygalactose transaminase